MDSHRVRSLIPYLNYSSLRKTKILPQGAMFTKIPRGGKMPYLAKKMNYDKFGLFMEEVIQKCLTGNLEKLQVKDELKRYLKINDYQEIQKLVCHHFISPQEVIYESEWSVEDIVGHPDIVYKDCVYDIKTTGRFNAMRSETILQVLSYFCLAQKSGFKISKVGLVLPAQRLILTYDLSEWKWNKFWEELKGCIKLKKERETLYDISLYEQIAFKQLCQKRVGMHIRKENLLDFICMKSPLQFFVGGRSSSIINLSSTFKNQLKTEINKHDGKVFIHAPYIINLSNPHGTKGREDPPWACQLLQKLLTLGDECNLSGIVVHCGKRKKLSLSSAIDEMKKAVESTLKETSFKCPLLLETSSGQGGEILCSPEELSSFWLSLPERIRSKVKICVDTCHVFAAGYNPMEYLCYLNGTGIPVALIHYNDSKFQKGAKKDRHASIGTGYIGFEEMRDVLEWSIFNNVPCVIE